jgi:hypothetical protein
MDLLGSLKMRASKASPYARTALLCACGERVLPIYEEYWVGSYFTAVGRSIELGWSYACGGKVDDQEMQFCLDGVQDLVSYYYEEQTRIGVLAATVTVVLRVLESISADEGASCLAVARGLCSTIHAANHAEAMANSDTPKPARTRVAESEEKAWQEAALSLIDGWKGVGTRTMFDSLEGKPPRWLLDWRARCKEVLHEPGDK